MKNTNLSRLFLMITLSVILLFQNCDRIHLNHMNSSSGNGGAGIMDDRYLMYGVVWLGFLDSEFRETQRLTNIEDRADRIVIVNDINGDQKKEFITFVYFSSLSTLDIRLRDGNTGSIIRQLELAQTSLQGFSVVENADGTKDILTLTRDTSTSGNQILIERIEKRSGMNLSIIKSKVIQSPFPFEMKHLIYSDLNFDGVKEIVAYGTTGINFYDNDLNLTSNIGYTFGGDVWCPSLEIAQDYDGDNFADHIVPCSTFSTMRGKISVYSGKSPGSEIWSVAGINQFEGVGTYSFLIDYNGDGFKDLAFTKREPIVNFNKHKLFIFDIKNNQYLLENFLPQTTLVPTPSTVDFFGKLDDYDDDGYEDFYYRIQSSDFSAPFNIVIHSGRRGIANPYLKVIECANSMQCGIFIANLNGN